MGYLDKYGGKEAYASSQRKRYKKAKKKGDKDLMDRLERDAKRVGYSLSSGSSKKSSSKSNSSKSSSDSTFDRYGGKEAYVSSQRKRYKKAKKKGDKDLIKRLEEDAARVGYNLTHDYLAPFGGRDAYITSQQKRYNQAVQEGNQELINRLLADAERVGYTLQEPEILPQIPKPKDAKTHTVIPPLYPQFQGMENFQYKQPNYSITRNPNDTSFVPTARAKDRYLTNQINQYNAGVQAYNTLMKQAQNAYNAGIPLNPIQAATLGLKEGMTDPITSLKNKYLQGEELTAEQKAILGIDEPSAEEQLKNRIALKIMNGEPLSIFEQKYAGLYTPPKTPKPINYENKVEQRIWQKFYNGEELTPDEREIIGLNVQTETSDTDIRQQAIQLAQKDLDWTTLTPEEKQQRINDYINLLTGETGTNITDEELLEYLK